MSSKLVKGSFIIMVGNVIFRIGGYIYRFLMATLLGPSMYGILGLTLPFQGIFQILAAGGLPPAIAKYVSQYNATNKESMAAQTIRTALKIMIFLGIFMGFLMVFFVAPWLANDIFHNKLALLPLQAIGLITPFSVIVGAFRGAFQGVYKMEYILYSRVIEQMFMILFATALVLLGLTAFGAVLGTVLGFVVSSIVCIYIYKNLMGKYIKKPEPNFKFPIKEELNLAKKLIWFSIPVSITALAEMAIYSVCTFIMGIFLTDNLIGYFTAADPIARLPLIISTSVATTILPASSEAFSTKNKRLLDKYVTKSYKYTLMLVIPVCIGIALFGRPIMQVVYFTNIEYILGSSVLSILVIGMTFYSIYAISSGIIQGIGNPKIPMYILIVGTIITTVLNWYLIPIYGIGGGAIATTIASLFIMIPSIYTAFKLTKANFPYDSIGKILIASLILGLVLWLIPYSVLGLIMGIIIGPIIYLIGLIILKVFDKEDIATMRSISNKLGSLSKILNRILDNIENTI